MADFSDLSGEPASLKTYATRYLNLADAIQSASAALKAVGEGSDNMLSAAVNEVRGKAKKGADDVGQAESRYRTTAQALLTYADALEAAQDKAKEARSDHETAAGSHAAAQAKADEFEDKAKVPGADQAADSKSATTWSTQATNLATSMGAAETKYNEAVADKEKAGNTAADAIEKVISDDGVSDSWWDKLVDFCEKIGDWVAIAALLLSWVPILGQVLLAVAAIISIIKLIDSLIKFANGEMTLGEVVAAAIGVVLSIVGGKAIMVALKGLKALSNGAKAAKIASKVAKRVDAGKNGKKTQTLKKELKNARKKHNKSVAKFKDSLKNDMKISKNDVKDELKETFTKPFTDLKDAFKNPAQLDDALKTLVGDGKKPDFLKALGKDSWDDVPALVKVEVVILATEHFGSAAETMLAPVLDVPLSLQSVLDKGSDAVTERVGDYVDGTVNR
jgi:hypothetical protein